MKYVAAGITAHSARQLGDPQRHLGHRTTAQRQHTYEADQIFSPERVPHAAILSAQFGRWSREREYLSSDAQDQQLAPQTIHTLCPEPGGHHSRLSEHTVYQAG